MMQKCIMRKRMTAGVKPCRRLEPPPKTQTEVLTAFGRRGGENGGLTGVWRLTRYQ